MEAPSLLELAVERFADLLAGGAVVEAAPGDGGDGLGSLLARLPAPVREGLARALSCRQALDAALLARLVAPRDLRALRLRGGGPPLDLGAAARACRALDVLALQSFRGGGDVGAALAAVGGSLVELDLCETATPPDALREFFVSVSVLLDAGANADIVDNKGRGPLHSAVTRNNVALTKLLLKHGADPHLRDAARETIMEKDAKNEGFRGARARPSRLVCSDARA